MRTIVLLGAGASRDAGFPLTNEFALALMKSMHEDFPASAPQVQVLNFVYGAMANHRSEHGGDPTEAVNVETMISAIRLLRTRGNHEAAPFIEGWKAPVGAWDLDDFAENARGQRQLKSALGRVLGNKGFGERDFYRAVANVARSVMGGRDNARIYEALEKDLLIRVRRLLREPKDVNYLEPLIHFAATQPGGLDVATLNYDRTVEIAAASAGVAVNTGIENWSLGQELQFPEQDGVLNLIKVHGSIDWLRRQYEPSSGERFLAGWVTERAVDSESEQPPAIVIGDREKLATEGPTLALLHAFERALFRADRLVVVGYSFGDAHINALVRDWINGDVTRTLTVLDPSWPSANPYRREAGFREGLTSSLGFVAPGDERPSRLHVVRETTASGLGRALHEAPVVEPVPRFALTLNPEGPDGVRITVENLGSNLRAVSFYPRRMNGSTGWPSSIEVTGAEAHPDEGGLYDSLVIPSMRRGATVDVHLTFNVPLGERDVYLQVTAQDELQQIVDRFEQSRDVGVTNMVPLPVQQNGWLVG